MAKTTKNQYEPDSKQWMIERVKELRRVRIPSKTYREKAKKAE